MGWFAKLFKRKPPAGGPLHLFVEVEDLGIAYGGAFQDKESASDAANLIVGNEVMKSGETMTAHYWTTPESLLDKHEKKIIQARMEVN